MLKKDQRNVSKPHIVWLYTLYKTKLEEYVNLLVRERKAIEAGQTEKLDDYEVMDKAIIDEIDSIHVCIGAWQQDKDLAANYRIELDKLREDTSVLLEQAKLSLEENKSLCEKKMNAIDGDLASIKKKTGSSSPYKKIVRPRFIDIKR